MDSMNDLVPPRVWQVVLVAAVVRLVTLLPALSAAPFSDEIEYHGLAQRLGAGQGYVTAEGRPTAYRPPLWPLAMSAVYRVTGPSTAAARVTQALLGALLAGLIVALAATAGLDARRQRWLAAWAVLSPTLLYYSHSLFSETLFALCLLSALRLLISRESAAGAGAWMGLACLCRGSALVLLALIAVWLATRRGWRLAAVWLGVAMLVIAPWTLRNKLVLGDLVPVDTNGALNFYWGNHERTPLLRPWDLVDQDDKPWPAAAGSSERAIERAAMAAARAHIAAEPGRFAVGLLTKSSALWGPERGLASGLSAGLYGPPRRLLALAAAAICALESWLLLALGGLGLLLGWARRTDLGRLTLLAAAGLTVIHALSYGHSRYRFGLVPLLMVAACGGWSAAEVSPSRRRWGFVLVALVTLNLAAQVLLELAR